MILFQKVCFQVQFYKNQIRCHLWIFLDFHLGFSKNCDIQLIWFSLLKLEKLIFREHMSTYWRINLLLLS